MRGECNFRDPLSDDQLYQALSDVSGPDISEIQNHLSACESCTERYGVMAVQLLLPMALHPTLEALIDYQSDMLNQDESQVIARHIQHCHLCQAEMETLQMLDIEPLVAPEMAPDTEVEPLSVFPGLTLPPIGQWVREIVATIIPRSVIAAQGWALAGEDNSLILDAKNARIYLQPENGRKGIVISGQLKLEDRTEQRKWYGALASLTPKSGERMVVAVVNEFGEFSFAPVSPGECRLQIQAMNNTKIVLESFFVNAELDQ